MKQLLLGKQTTSHGVENLPMIFFPAFPNGSFVFCLTAQLMMKYFSN